MAKEHGFDNRRSRWIWEQDDVIIIKKSDVQPENASDQAKDETPAYTHTSVGETSSQDSKKEEDS